MSWEEITELFNLNQMMELEEGISYILNKRKKKC